MITENQALDYLKKFSIEKYTKLSQFNKQKMDNIIKSRNNIIAKKLNEETPLTFDEREFFYNFYEYLEKEYLTSIYPELFSDFYFLELYFKYRLTLKNDYSINYHIDENDKFFVNKHLNNLDLNQLAFFYDEWNLNIITNENLYKEEDKLKNEIKKEVKNQIPKYNKNTLNRIPIFNFNPTSSYTMLILHSKFVYLLCIKIIETFNTKNNFHKLILNKTEIRFTQISLVHILIRHYSPLSKISEHYINKSNHELDFPPEQIHLQLEKIFSDIDNSTLVNNIRLFENLRDKKNTQINFQFKDNTYKVWVSLNQNQNQKGGIPYKQIETFHPLDDENELKTMKLNFKKEKINDELYLYIPMTN